MEANPSAWSPENAFVFLTQPIQKILAKSVSDANSTFLQFFTEYPEQYEFAIADRKGIVDFIRVLFRGALQNNFQAIEDVKFRKENGNFLIEFARTYVVHFKKLAKLTSPPLPVWIPKTLVRASDEQFYNLYYGQPLLPTMDEVEVRDIPLKQLKQIVGCLLFGQDGTITGLHFHDQVGKEVRSTFELDLSQYAVITPIDNIENTGKTAFKLKKSSMKLDTDLSKQTSG